MIIKRKETIVNINDINLHFFDEADRTLDELRTIEADAKKAYDNNPNLSNKLLWIRAKAEYMFGDGKQEDAVKYLRAEIDKLSVIEDAPEVLHKILDVYELCIDYLLRLKRPQEAFDLANSMMDIADNNFEDTFDYARCEGLYGICCMAIGDKKQAQEFLQDAMVRVKDALAEMESLRDSLEHNLGALNK